MNHGPSSDASILVGPSVFATGVIVAVATLMFLSSCSKKNPLQTLPVSDSLAIIADNLAHRAEVDSFFRHDRNSPFHRDTLVTYHGINWFPINPYYRGQSTLHRYDHPDTVDVLGTKGEKRRELRYGYFEFAVPGDRETPSMVRLNVYKFTPYDGERYLLFKDNLSVWFTDKTTGEETYGVGRYVEIGNEQPDPSFVYTIDLNKAFNPYCAYSNLYSCAIPRKEDHLDVALRVGEKKYHPEESRSSP
jgi:uncharacterized protein